MAPAFAGLEQYSRAIKGKFFKGSLKAHLDSLAKARWPQPTLTFLASQKRLNVAVLTLTDNPTAKYL